MDAVDQVVGVHHGVYVGLGHCCFEGRQVDFTHGALVGIGADVVPVVLLIIEGIMLYRGDNALGLDALNPRNRHARGQKGILRKIFKVAAGKGRAGNIHSGSEQKIHAAGAGIPAQTLAYPARQGCIPCCGQRCSAGPRSGRSPGAYALRSIGHFQAWQPDGRCGVSVHFFNSTEQIDFLLKSEFG